MHIIIRDFIEGQSQEAGIEFYTEDTCKHYLP